VRLAQKDSGKAHPARWMVAQGEFLRILRADLTLIDTGRRLGVGISHAKRLRDRARLEAQLLRTPVDYKVTLVRDGKLVRI
jgi:hypothetical protein